MSAVKLVTQADIDRALKEVEEKCHPETANLLRQLYEAQDGQLRLAKVLQQIAERAVTRSQPAR